VVLMRRNRRRGPRRSRRGRGIGRNIFGRGWDARRVQNVRLCQSVSLSTNSGGTLASLIYNDPFTASFTEYTSDWVNLYGQFKLLGSRIQFVSTIETKGQTAVVAIGYQNRQTGLAAPTSVNNVLDNQPSQLWALSNDTTSHGFTMQQSMNGLLYAATSASANTSTDSTGAPGGWQIYGSGMPASTVVAFCKQEVFYQFRSRS